MTAKKKTTSDDYRRAATLLDAINMLRAVKPSNMGIEGDDKPYSAVQFNIYKSGAVELEVRWKICDDFGAVSLRPKTAGDLLVLIREEMRAEFEKLQGRIKDQK